MEREILLERRVALILQAAQDAVLQIDVPNTAVWNSLVRPPLECWRLVARGFALSNMGQSLMRWWIGMMLGLGVLAVIGELLGPDHRSAVMGYSLHLVAAVTLILAFLRAPSEVSADGLSLDPILRVASAAGKVGLGSDRDVDLVEKGLKRREARSASVVSGFKWFSGIAWTVWAFFFTQVVTAALAPPVSPATAAPTLAVGLAAVAAVYVIAQAYAASTDAIFAAAFAGLDQARLELPPAPKTAALPPG